MPAKITVKKERPQDLLKRLRQNQVPKDRLQAWMPNRHALWFACGNGRECVYVTSTGGVISAEKPFNTKLTRGAAENYYKGFRAIQGQTIFKGINRILKAYVHFEDQRLYTFLPLWTIGTYAYSVFGHYGYLFFYSTLMRSGKTRVQEVLSHLAFEATTPQNAPTPATIREMASEGRTVQLDTLERWEDKSQESFAAAMEILDAGFRSGGQVPKMVPAGNGKWVKEVYPVYAPYVLSGISRDSLSETALDRAFAFEMVRKPIRVTKERYIFEACERRCKNVRGSVYIWALQNAKALSELYHCAQLDADVRNLHLNDRAADIWQPIFAVALAVNMPKNSKEWADLTALAVELGGDPDYAEEQRQLGIVRTLRGLVNQDRKVIGMTSELLQPIVAAGIQIEDLELTHLLHQWGFVQKEIRLPRGPRRAWELDDRKLAGIEQQLTGGKP
jgi:hypothetical protein